MKFRVITRGTAAGSYTVEADSKEHAEGIMSLPGTANWNLIEQDDFSVFRVEIQSAEEISDASR